METEKTRSASKRPRAYIPFLIFLGLAFIFFLTSTLSGRTPQIDSLNPKIGRPGDVLVIKGKHFGKDREGAYVSIAGIIPTSSAYLEWKDSRISVTVPGDVNSGLVYVVTKKGKSKGVLFTNKDQIPVVLSGPAAPGLPYIQEIDPTSSAVGRSLTITGMNFGMNQGDSLVYFSWLPADEEPQYDGSALSHFIAGQETNLDYLLWSDRELKVRVPDGATSGNLFVSTAKGNSNSVYLEISNPAGTKVYKKRQTYTVSYSVVIKDVRASANNSLYIWIPRILSDHVQRDVQLLSRDRDPLFDNYNGLMLYQLKEIETGRHTRFRIPSCSTGMP